jgi:hypothetical protein
MAPLLAPQILAQFMFPLPVAGRLVYVETILVDDDPTDPTIHIVSMHDA